MKRRAGCVLHGRVGQALALALAPLAGAWAGTGIQHAAEIRFDVLASGAQAWNGVPYGRYPAGQAQLTVLRLVIPPHTVLPWHVHPMPSTAYVLSGHLTLEDRGGSRRLVRAGEAFIGAARAVHRSITGAAACVLIVTYAGVPGQPIAEAPPDERAPARLPRVVFP